MVSGFTSEDVDKEKRVGDSRDGDDAFDEVDESQSKLEMHPSPWSAAGVLEKLLRVSAGECIEE